MKILISIYKKVYSDYSLISVTIFFFRVFPNIYTIAEAHISLAKLLYFYRSPSVSMTSKLLCTYHSVAISVALCLFFVVWWIRHIYNISVRKLQQLLHMYAHQRDSERKKRKMWSTAYKNNNKNHNINWANPFCNFAPPHWHIELFSRAKYRFTFSVLYVYVCACNVVICLHMHTFIYTHLVYIIFTGIQK